MFSAVKVFSATKAKDRDSLGERVSAWVQQQRPQIVSTMVRQSSDNQFHCLTIVIFYNEGA